MSEAGYSFKPAICKQRFCDFRQCNYVDPNAAGKSICSQNFICPNPEDLERLAKIQEGKEIVNSALGILAYKKQRDARDKPINTMDWCYEMFNEEPDKAHALKKKEAKEMAIYNLQLIDNKRRQKLREAKLNDFSCKQPRNNINWMCRLFTENCDEAAKYYPYQTSSPCINLDTSITKCCKRLNNHKVSQPDFLTTAYDLNLCPPCPDPETIQFHCQKEQICREREQNLTRKITEIPCCIDTVGTNKVQYIPLEQICESKRLGKVTDYSDVMNREACTKYKDYICKPCQHPSLHRYLYDPTKDWNQSCPMKCAYQQDMKMWKNYSSAIKRERDCQCRKYWEEQQRNEASYYCNDDDNEANYPFPFFSPRVRSNYERQARIGKKKLGQVPEFDSTAGRLGFACDLLD